MRILNLLLLLIAANLCAQDTTYLIFNEPCDTSLPGNFRRSNGPFIRTIDVMPDITGLASLNASGSAEFCRLNIKAIASGISSKKITVVDLRQESHGFVNGLSVSWYGKYDWGNVGLSRTDVEANEKQRLDSLLNAKHILVTKFVRKDRATDAVTETEQIPLEVKDVQTEKQLTEDFNLGYFRVTVTDYRPPLLEDVDRFVEFVRGLDKNVWLHFHCYGGYGRTTTFMAMYDMMRNAKQVSLADILQRQYLLGGIDLASGQGIPEFGKQYAVEFTEFPGRFYDYCKTNTDNFATPYSTWLKK